MVKTACTECPVRPKSFCGVVPSTDMQALAISRRTARFRRGQSIAGGGEPPAALFNIVSGVVKLYRSLPDGRTQILGLRFPGEFFTVPGAGNAPISAEAVTPVEACRFSQASLKRLTHRFPQLPVALLERTRRHLAALEDHLLLLGRMTAKEKVAWFLLRHVRRLTGRNDPAGRRVELVLTQGEIADLLGLTKETVSRVFSRLAREGLITLNPLRLTDIDSLSRICLGYTTRQ